MAFTITIDQEEIETAIKNHVRSKVAIAEGQDVTIEMKAGRGDNGFSATIEIGTSLQTNTAKPVKATVTPAQTQVASASEDKAAPAAETTKQADAEQAPVVAEEVAEPVTGKNKLFGAATTGRNIP